MVPASIGFSNKESGRGSISTLYGIYLQSTEPNSLILHIAHSRRLLEEKTHVYQMIRVKMIVLK